MKKIKILAKKLAFLGLDKEALLITSLIKTADSRRNIIQRLQLTKEEADYFHNLSSQKAYDLARWFKEWRNKNSNKYSSFEDEFYSFKQEYTLSGDSEYLYEPTEYSLIDTIIEDDSFYQSVKNKTLNEIFYGTEKKSSPFDRYVLKKGYLGFEYSKSKEYTWYDVGQECEIVSTFLSNCGSIGNLGNEGEFMGEGDFTMMALKDKDKRPVMVITVGTAYSPDFGDTKKVIVNASVGNNKFPTDPDLLQHLFDFARREGYHFAYLYDAISKEEITQVPGLKRSIIEGTGFNIISAELGADFDSEDENTESNEEN